MKINEKRSEYRTAAASPPPTRITVRLKPELAQRVDAERRARKLSVTAVIERALESYLDGAEAPRKLSLLDALRKHGVLGAVDMGPEASVDYKTDLTQYLDQKHGSR